MTQHRAARLASFSIRILAFLGLAFPLALPVAQVRAGCADFAEPGVEWRRCMMDGADLTDVDLTGAVLRDSSFKRADLSGSILREVDARRAKFVSAKLLGVVLDGANLARADLTSADLSGASLREADLRGAKLYQTILRDADLTGARLGGADMLRADLTGARWIDGKSICGEGSIGRCLMRKSPRAAATGG